jgi:hypothetical protein
MVSPSGRATRGGGKLGSVFKRGIELAGGGVLSQNIGAESTMVGSGTSK